MKMKCVRNIKKRITRDREYDVEEYDGLYLVVTGDHGLSTLVTVDCFVSISIPNGAYFDVNENDTVFDLRK